MLWMWLVLTVIMADDEEDDGEGKEEDGKEPRPGEVPIMLATPATPVSIIVCTPVDAEALDNGGFGVTARDPWPELGPEVDCWTA